MRDAALIAQVTAQPWLVHGPVADAFAAVVSRHAAGLRLSPDEVAEIAGRGRGAADRLARSRRTLPGAQAVSVWDTDPAEVDPSQLITVSRTVAVVPITGVLAKHSSMVNGVSQPQGLGADTAEAMVEAAGRMAGVRSVVLQIFSPGGQVAGNDQVRAAIARVRASGRRVVAYADDVCASGGYRLAIACESVWANPMAQVGSVGACTLLEDSSERFRGAGVRRVTVRSGRAKMATGYDGTPLGKDQLDAVQAEIDALAGQFLGEVVAARGLSEAQAEETASGAVFIAADARRLGLIDGVLSLAELVDNMNQNAPAAADAAARAA